MTEPAPFQPGIHTLIHRHAAWLRGRRIGLLSHAAAVDARGRSSAGLLLADKRWQLTAIFGPEHGFFGLAGAGEPVATRRHPVWPVPVLSLYGRHRSPTPALLRNVDVVVVDLQDLAVRCYTYVSTLKAMLEAATAAGKPVIVADRPVPFPATVDGPLPAPDFESFVCAIAAPLVYGMTPGETARWIRDRHALALDLRVAPMQGYRRGPRRGDDWPPWIPPSPAIATWESAWCYPATVCTEALPSLDCGRTGRLPFQCLGAPWLNAAAVCERLAAARLPGLHVEPHVYRPAGRRRPLTGLRLAVSDPRRFQPVTTGVTLLHTLQALYGAKRLWHAPRARPAFFDKLYGTDRVRRMLLDGASTAQIVQSWQPGQAAFQRERRAALLYP